MCRSESELRAILVSAGLPAAASFYGWTCTFTSSGVCRIDSYARGLFVEVVFQRLGPDLNIRFLVESLVSAGHLVNLQLAMNQIAPYRSPFASALLCPEYHHIAGVGFRHIVPHSSLVYSAQVESPQPGRQAAADTNLNH